jgi:hypothetical protein
MKSYEKKSECNKSFFEKEYIQNKKSIRTISKEIKWDYDTVSKYLHKFNIKIRTNSDRKHLTGKKFGKLRVIERVGNYNGGCFFWKCKCDCGVIENVSSYKLTSNKKTACKKCTWKRNGLKMTTGIGDINGKFIGTIKKGAVLRNLNYELDNSYLWELFLQQNKKCALSGLEISFGGGIGVKRTEITASLDRIDSNKGYTKDNVQWVHKHINKLKWDFPQNYFLDLVKRIAKHLKLK